MAENTPVSGEIDNTTVLLLGIGALAFFLFLATSSLLFKLVKNNPSACPSVLFTPFQAHPVIILN